MINHQGFSLGVVGMSNVDTMDSAQSTSISGIDLTKSYEGEENKKVNHNLKRMLVNSPARSIVAVGATVVIAAGSIAYALSSGEDAQTQGRDLQALETVEFNYSETGRDQLTQEQVDHIQRQTELKARAAAQNSESYTPQFADVVTTTVEEKSLTEDLQQSQVTFDGVVPGGDYVDSNTVRDASFANNLDYSSSSNSNGAINYASGVNSAMPPPAAQAQQAQQAQPSQPMQQGQGSENATYATNNSGSGNGDYSGGGGGGGDGGMGAGGPNPTGIDPSVEALRQSLEDDYNNQQAMSQQYTTAQQAQLEAQRQAVQQATAQRQQAVQQSFQQSQQQLIAQQNNGMGFTAATYIPKSTNSSNGNIASNIWNNDLSDVASGASVNNQAGNQASSGQQQEEVKDLPSHVVRVGTTWNVVVENSVNTDNGTTVFARTLSGPYAGSRLVGKISTTGLGNRSAGVIFETLIPERRNKNAIPIQAVAMTLGNLDTHVATSVNRHYLQRYAALIAQGVTGGYAEAYQDTSGSVSQIVNPDGTITTVSANETPTSEEVRGQVIGQLGNELQGEFQAIRVRPTTYKIEQGTPLTVMFTSNVNPRTAKVDSIQVGSNGRYSNTSSYGMQPRNN